MVCFFVVIIVCVSSLSKFFKSFRESFVVLCFVCFLLVMYLGMNSIGFDLCSGFLDMMGMVFDFGVGVVVVSASVTVSRVIFISVEFFLFGFVIEMNCFVFVSLFSV